MVNTKYVSYTKVYLCFKKYSRYSEAHVIVNQYL